MHIVITRPNLFLPRGYEITLTDTPPPAGIWVFSFAVPEKTARLWFEAVDAAFDTLFEGIVWVIGEGPRFRHQGVKRRLMAMLAADVEALVASESRADAKIAGVLAETREGLRAAREMDRAKHRALAERDGLI